MTKLLRCAILAGGVFLCAVTAAAQNAPAKPQARANASQPKIDGVALAIMIKSTIAAVQHANATGNYSVLRDLGTPRFRDRYDQAQLTLIFGNLRSRGVNLSSTLMLMPNLIKQ